MPSVTKLAHKILKLRTTRASGPASVAAMLATAQTFTLDGIAARPVRVEVDVHRGLPAFSVVGLPDAAVREARERVRAAIANCGFDFPLRRIVANLAPASLRKAGPGLDLPIAVALLVASGQLEWERLPRLAMVGELALDGTVAPDSRGCWRSRRPPVSRAPRRSSSRPRTAPRRRWSAESRCCRSITSRRSPNWPEVSGRRIRRQPLSLPLTSGSGRSRPRRPARPAAPALRARGCGRRRPQPADGRPSRRRQVACRGPPAFDPAAAERRGGTRGRADRQRLRAPRRRLRRRQAVSGSASHRQSRRRDRRRQPARPG